MRARGTVVIFRRGRVLLVRERGHRRFSLPGGGVKHGEPTLAAAVRELYEELGMKAHAARRVSSCDWKGRVSWHKVCLIETEDEPRLRSGEIAQFVWWDMKTEIPRHVHVDRILKKLRGEER